MTRGKSKNLAGYLIDLLSDIAHLAVKITIVPIQDGYRGELLRITHKIYDSTRRRLGETDSTTVTETDKLMQSIREIE